MKGSVLGMEAITEGLKLDISSLVMGLFLVLSAIIAAVTIIGRFSEIVGKPVKWIKKKNADHELLLKTSDTLHVLLKKQEEDVAQSIRHDELIRKDLNVITKDIRDSIKETQAQIHQFSENRVHDREQSLRIQKELTDSIKVLAEGAAGRKEQIAVLQAANKELLADKINQKYKQYLMIDGIPADEVGEFTNLHDAYKNLGGNHAGDQKYDYVMKNLPVIPVERQFVNTDNER